MRESVSGARFASASGNVIASREKDSSIVLLDGKESRIRGVCHKRIA